MTTRAEMIASLSFDRLAASMRAHAPTGPQVEAHLDAAVTQMATSPGKMVRARLTQTAGAACGLNEDVVIRTAVAMEFFHLASLLLDDLPCMDDAVLRRGRLCTHRVHGEATAILAALAFINRAYALVGAVGASAPADAQVRTQLELDRCLGAAGLVGGQARDLAFGSGERSVREVGRVAAGKTAAMIALSLLLPAHLAGADAEERAQLKALALYWGLLFQALDDLGDVLATSVSSGKMPGRDRALGRPSFVLVLGVAGTSRQIARWLALAERTHARLVGRRAGWSRLGVFQKEFQLTAASMARVDHRVAA